MESWESRQFSVYDGLEDHVTLKIKIVPLVLKLRTAFGTAHSSSTYRTNALITIQRIRKLPQDSNDQFGFGECGLPPKKPGIYYADYNDILYYVQKYVSILESTLTNPKTLSDHYDPFKHLTHRYFNGVSVPKDISILFKALDSMGNLKDGIQRCGNSGMEMAIFDLLGHINQKSLNEMIGFRNDPMRPPFVSFYTIALNENFKEMMESASFGLGFTSNLKLKVNEDINLALRVLEVMDEMTTRKYSANGDSPCYISIDANSSWTAQTALLFLQSIENKPFAQRIFMVEQPWSVDFFTEYPDKDKSVPAWIEVKQKYLEKGIGLFADESMATIDDIEKVCPYVSGVNIKLEKAGGIRAALEILGEANKRDLAIWIGVMVGSTLNSSAAANLVQGTKVGGDFDGGLLVCSDSDPFEGGFTWGKHGTVILHSDRYGIGVTKKS